MSSDFIYVQCVEDTKGKVRLRIVNSTGYNQSFNCQAPKAIREEGVVYKLTNPKVTVIQKEGHAPFYKLTNDISKYQAVLTATKHVTVADLKEEGLPVFEEEECVICISNKPVLLYDCGHLCTCNACHGMMINKICPMCRVSIKKYTLVNTD